MKCRECNNERLEIIDSEYHGEYSVDTLYCKYCNKEVVKFYDKKIYFYGR
jgi:hypothetical protein